MTGSGADDQDPSESYAAIEDLAAGWVVDRGNDRNWTPGRQAELDAWLAQSLAHRVAFVRVEAGWRRANRLAALRNPTRQTPYKHPTYKTIWIRGAAVVGLAIVTGLFSQDYFFQPKSQLIETPKGGQERLTLADGSQIELNTDSALRIDLSGNRRSVELVRGEAYFQITHNSEQPFVVKAAGRKIVDLGTKFTVRSGPRSLQVALLEGSVRLEDSGEQRSSHPITLYPGDVATADGKKISVAKITKKLMTDRLAWQRGGLVFHGTALVDAIAEFNRYGGAQLILADQNIATLTINGRFKISGAEAFAANLHELFGMRIEHHDGIIVLGRRR